MSVNSNRQENGKQVGNLLADAEFLEEIRRQMIRFATLQLGDSHQAEDAVQDALVGAMKNASSLWARRIKDLDICDPEEQDCGCLAAQATGR